MAPAVVAPTVAVAAPVSRSANPLPEPTDAPEATAPVRRTTRRVASAATEAPEGLLAVMAEQTRLLGMLREEVQRLSEHVDRSARRARLGVFVDVPNLLYGAEPGQRLDMGKLLAILCKDRELVRATAYAPVSDNPSEPVQQQRFVAEQLRIVRLEHTAAGTGGCHHVGTSGEFIDQLFGQGARRGPVTGVEAGLSTAGLRRRDDHRATGRFEQPQGRETDAGPHHVDEAGNEQSDAHG